MLKIPRELITCPRPPQVEHVFEVEPGSAPEPRQDSHKSSFVTAISFSQPNTASSNEIITQVSAAPRAGRILPFAAEQFIEDAAGAGAEDFAENLKRIMEAAAPKTSAGARARIEGSMAVPVVSGPRLRIAQGFVGFAQFLEFFLGGFVAGIFIGMILEGQFAIGLFDFLLAGAAVHPEDIVIIALGHGGQTAGFLATTTLAGRIRRSRNL